MYFDNKGELQKGTVNNSLADKFLDPIASQKFTPEPGNFVKGKTETVFLTYVDFLQLIDKQRKTSNGNYDAMFGKVCNFHWSFLSDGSYDITIELVSIGDIIESFKINALISGIDTSAKVEGTKKDPSQMTSSEVIEDYANKNEIGKYFWKLIGPDAIEKEKNASEELKNDTTNSSVYTYSDVRLKTNIKFLNKINGLNIYQYNYIWDLKTTHKGIIAQEILNNEYSKAVSIHNLTGYYMVDYSKLPNICKTQ
jgi:hypothetical protein